MTKCHILKKLYNFEAQRSPLKISGIITLSCCPVIVTINVLLIASLIATKQSLNKASNLLIVSLSISDSLMGAVLIPFQSIENIWQNICPMAMVITMLQTFFLVFSLSMTILLAADRYLHMDPNFRTSPSRIAKLFTIPWIYAMISIAFLLSALTAAGTHFVARLGLESMIYVNICFVVVLLAILSAIVALYARGYLRIRRFVADNPVYANRDEPESSENPDYLNKLFKTVLLLLIAMLVSFVPILLTNTILMFTTLTGVEPSPGVQLIILIVNPILNHTNTVTNACIIFYRNEKSKEWLVTKVFKCCRKTENREEELRSVAVICNTRTTGV